MTDIKTEWREAIEKILNERDMAYLVFGNVDEKIYEKDMEKVDLYYKNKIRLEKLKKLQYD